MRQLNDLETTFRYRSSGLVQDYLLSSNLVEVGDFTVWQLVMSHLTRRNLDCRGLLMMGVDSVDSATPGQAGGDGLYHQDG